MIEFFLKLYQAFAESNAMFEELDLQPVKFIDRMRGQPLNPAQFEYYAMPAVFVATKTTWKKVGKSYQGTNVIEFHVVTDATWDTSNIATSKEEGLKQTMFHQMVHLVLDDLESEYTGKLTRLDDELVDSGVVIYTVLRYECSVYDSIQKPRDYVDVMIDKLYINGKLKKTL